MRIGVRFISEISEIHLDLTLFSRLISVHGGIEDEC